MFKNCIIASLLIVLILIFFSQWRSNRENIDLGDDLQKGLTVRTDPNGNFEIKIPDLEFHLAYLSSSAKYESSKEPTITFSIGDSPGYSFYGIGPATKEPLHMEVASPEMRGIVNDMDLDGFPDEALLAGFGYVKLQVWAVDENGSLLKQVGGDSVTDNKKSNAPANMK